MLKKGMKILFQGDSITDAGRDRENDHELGTGYAMMLSAYFRALYPQLNLTFINRGVSGDRSIDMRKRWQQDCIDLKPDLVSILIGINDTWRKFDESTSDTEYEENIRYVLTEIKEKLNAEIILIEPFFLALSREHSTMFRDDLELKIRRLRELAKEFNTMYIPMDGIFAGSGRSKPNQYWAGDAVHPSKEGHALISYNWIKTIEKEYPDDQIIGCCSK